MKTLKPWRLIALAVAAALSGTAGCAHSTSSSRQIATADSGRSSELYPARDEFVRTDSPPEFDSHQLASKVVYPEAARKKNIEGKVTVEALIDTQGKVVQTEILQSDDEILNDAARQAVISTSFTPAMVNGKPVAVWIAIPILFKLK